MQGISDTECPQAKHRRIFGDLAWEVPEMLDRLGTASDVYLGRIPAFTTGANFGSHVRNELAAGVLVDGPTRLIDEIAREYPANSVIVAAAGPEGPVLGNVATPQFEQLPPR